MSLVKPTNLACPLDGSPLQADDHRYLCAEGHCFDRARQGYLNLLPVQFKNSKAPGDSKEMIAARNRFLSAGYYQPLAEALYAFSALHLSQIDSLTLLDAGCGEGYYLDEWLQRCSQQQPEKSVSPIGLDISKSAILASAKRNKQVTWLVGSSAHLPLLDCSVDLIFSLFAYPDYAQFARVLKPGGKLVLVDAAEEHLIELREVIYPEVRRRSPPSIAKAEAQGFQLIDQQSLRFQTEPLPQATLQDLLLMTPHLFRAPRAGREAAAQLQQLSLSVDFCLRHLSLTEVGVADSTPI